LNRSTKSSKRACCAATLAAGGREVASFKVRWKRSWPPFCWGCPGSIRSKPMPIFSQFSDKALSPHGPAVAKGGPLSLRIARGRPQRSNTGTSAAATAVELGSTIRQRRT